MFVLLKLPIKVGSSYFHTWYTRVLGHPPMQTVVFYWVFKYAHNFCGKNFLFKKNLGILDMSLGGGGGAGGFVLPKNPGLKDF